MKKYLVLYAFLNFIFNSMVTIIFRSIIFDNLICLEYGHFYGVGNPMMSTRIDAGLEGIFFLSIYILINIKIYKYVNKQYNFQKVNYLIPLSTMILGIISVVLLGYVHGG